MKLKERLRQLEAREHDFQCELAQARAAAEHLHEVGRSLSSAVVVGSGLVLGAVAARIPARVWSLSLAVLLLAGCQAARLPIARWLLVEMTRQQRHWRTWRRAQARSGQAPDPD